jgi:hypothetical protein
MSGTALCAQANRPGVRHRLWSTAIVAQPQGSACGCAVVRITMPKVFSAADNDIYRSLAATSDFDPRPAFPKEAQHAG